MKASVLLAVATAVVFIPAHSSAYCAPGSDITASTVRVVVHSAMASQLLHADGTAWTSAELDRAVWHVVSAINESANADVPLLYFDQSHPSSCTWLDTTCNSGSRPELTCYEAGTLVLLPSNCLITQNEGNGTGSALIHFPRSNNYMNLPGNGIRWTHGIFGGGADNFDNTLMHEIGHALGLGHPDGSWGGLNCTPPASPTAACPAGALTFGCPVMLGDRGRGYSGHTYGLDDVDALQFVWGVRPIPVARNFESIDLSTNTFSEWAFTDYGIAGRLAASSRAWEFSPFRQSVTIAGLRRGSSFDNQVTVIEWNWNNGTANFISHLSFATRLTDVPGVAETGSQRVVVGNPILSNGTSRHFRRSLVEFRSLLSAGGTGWSNASTTPIAGAVDDTLTAGVASAFDPTSQVVLHAFRSDTGEVVLQGRGSAWSAPRATGIRSFTTPAIACAPSTCMLAVLEPMYPAPGFVSNATRLQWVEFSWNQSTSNWTPGVLRTSSWSMTGSISAAAVRRPAGGYDFVVSSSFIQTGGTMGQVWGSRAFAYRHTAGSTTMVLLFPQVVDSPGTLAFSPVGGTGIYAEMFSFAQ